MPARQKNWYVHVAVFISRQIIGVKISGASRQKVGSCVAAFKNHENGRNKSQHCCVLLGVVGQQSCIRLHGPKSLTGIKL